MMGRRNLFLAAVTVGSAFVTDGVNAQLTALGSSDLGTPAIAGSHTGSGSDWAVTAAGTDIWGGSDQGHFLYFPRDANTTDVMLTCRVESFPYVNGWQKGGIMIRDTLAANSKHQFIAAIGAGYAHQYRAYTGGGSTNPADDTSSTYSKTPWLRMVKIGNTITSYVKQDGEYDWLKVHSIESVFSSDFYLGLAVTSHEFDQPTTLTVSNLEIITGTPGDAIPTTITCGTQENKCIAGHNMQKLTGVTKEDCCAECSFNPSCLGIEWFTEDVGTSWKANDCMLSSSADAGGCNNDIYKVEFHAKTGFTMGEPIVAEELYTQDDFNGILEIGDYGAKVKIQQVAEGVFNTWGAGNGIGGVSDSFLFNQAAHTGDVVATMYLDKLERKNANTSGGLMIRAGLEANAPHVSLLVQSNSGVTMFSRTTTDGDTAILNDGVWEERVELKLVKIGTTVTCSYRPRGGDAPWYEIGSATVEAFADEAAGFYVGQAHASAKHAQTVIITAELFDVQPYVA